MESKMTPGGGAAGPADGLAPRHHHPLWDSLIADRGDGDAAEVMTMRWFVGDVDGLTI